MPGIPSTLRPALEGYATLLRARFGARLRDVRLFGSCARGDADEDSDIDVLVLVDGLTQSELSAVIDTATAVGLEHGLPLAPLPMASAELDELRRQGRLLARDIDREGLSL